MNLPAVFQLRVTLIGIKPPVWRRVQIESDTTLDRLHQILQCLFRWEDCHLHEFHAGGRAYGKPARGMEFLPRQVLDERRFRLDQLLSRKGEKFHYIYDFGDDWLHEVRLESVLPAEEGVLYPRCIAGARSGPPEDIGGVPGYAFLLKALADSRHPMHGAMLELYGPFDPEAFSVDSVNATLQARFHGQRKSATRRSGRTG